MEHLEHYRVSARKLAHYAGPSRPGNLKLET
jgi:hypothetical protein